MLRCWKTPAIPPSSPPAIASMNGRRGMTRKNAKAITSAHTQIRSTFVRGESEEWSFSGAAFTGEILPSSLDTCQYFSYRYPAIALKTPATRHFEYDGPLFLVLPI